MRFASWLSMVVLGAVHAAGATVQMATFFGGIGNDSAVQVLTGRGGRIYLAGVANSPDLPQGRFLNSPLNRPHDIGDSEAFLACFSAGGSKVEWTLYFGGVGAEGVISAVADGAGAVYVLGWTSSPDFPVTPGAWRTRIAGISDTFVAKIPPDGSRLEWATFLGVLPDALSQPASGSLLAVDSAGTVFVAGREAGPNFRSTPGAYRETGAIGRGFAVRLNARGSAPLYATYLHAGAPTSILADASGALLIAGSGGGDFENLLGSPGGMENTGFVMKLNPEGAASIFRTRLQASRSLAIDEIQTDAAGVIYLLGSVFAADFPSLNPLPQTPGAPGLVERAFLARVAADGKTLLAATSFSGREFQQPDGAPLSRPRMSVRPNGSLCLLNVPLTREGQTPGGLGTKTTGGPGLICVAESLNRYLFRTMIPLPGGSSAASLALDGDGSVLVAGTATALFSPTPESAQPGFGGASRFHPIQAPFDAFLMRITPSNQTPRLRALSPDALLRTSLPPLPGQPPPAIMLYGENFTAGLEADVEGRRLPLEIISPVQASLPWTDPSLYAAAEMRVALSLPVPEASRSEDRILTIYNPTPDPPSLVPDSAPLNSDELRLTVHAHTLTASSTLLWNGTPRQAAFRAEPGPALELVLTSEDLAQAGRLEVRLADPGPGGGLSPPAYFTVTAPEGAQTTTAPTLHPMPDPFLEAAPGQSLTRQITGRNFTSATRVTWNGEPVVVTSSTPQSLLITFSPELLSRGGQGALVAANDGQFSNEIPAHLVKPRPLALLAADPVRRRAYEVALEGERQLLRVVDLDRNEVLHRHEIALGNNLAVRGITVSEEGSFVYWIRADNGSLTRFNADTLDSDVQLQFSDPNTWPVSIFPLPDRPGAYAVELRNGDVVIYDGPAQRGPSLFELGLARSNRGFVFATRNTIFTVGGPEDNPQCLPSIRYGAFGLTGLGPDCRNAVTPELTFDRGLTYLAGEERILPLRITLSGLAPLIPVRLAADLTRRSVLVSTLREGTWRVYLDSLRTQRLLPGGENIIVPLSTREILVQRRTGVVLLKVPD